MPPAPRPADARHSSPAGDPPVADEVAADPAPDPAPDPTPAPDPVIRSITFDGEPAFFALAPLGHALVSRTAPVRSYASGAVDPLPAPGVSQAFKAIDVDAWLVPALALVDRALSPRYAGPADALAGGRAPLARLVAARRALVERIATRTTPLVAGRGDLTAATAALRRVLDASLSEGWGATTVAQLPVSVDATVADGRPPVIELDVAVAEHGAPSHVTVAPSELGLDGPGGTLDLVVHVADPARRRRRTLDLTLDVAVPAPPSPLAASGTDPAPGPWSTRVEVPVPVRAQPESLAAVGQTAEATATGDAAATLRDAVAWTYTATFEAPAADQDELDLRVTWNAAASSDLAVARLAGDGAAGPFVALAELTSNHDAIRADLERLPRPSPDPDPAPDPEEPDPDPVPAPDPAPTHREALVSNPAGPSVSEPVPDAGPSDEQRAISALTALATLTEQLVADWGQGGPDPAIGSSTAHDGTATLRLGFELPSGPDDAEATVAFVLRRETATWGPEGQRPRIGSWCDGELVVLDPEPADGNPDTLRYVVDPRRSPAPGERRRVTLEYRDLSAVVTRTARAAAWTIRNARLVPGADPVPTFVLRTAETSFPSAAVPALSADDPIAIGSGRGAGFTAALTAALRTLLGAGPYDETHPWVALTVSISSRIGPDGPETTQPILLVPPQAYDDPLPAQVGATVVDWLTQRGPALPPVSTVSVELRLLAGATAAGSPLAVLRRLDYRLTP